MGQSLPGHAAMKTGSNSARAGEDDNFEGRSYSHIQPIFLLFSEFLGPEVSNSIRCLYIYICFF